jgi:hypothetical protein
VGRVLPAAMPRSGENWSAGQGSLRIQCEFGLSQKLRLTKVRFRRKAAVRMISGLRNQLRSTAYVAPMNCATGPSRFPMPSGTSSDHRTALEPYQP